MFHKTIQRLLLTFGAGAMLFGALIGGSGFNRGSWVQVPAKVVDVTTECHMEATERGVVSKTTYTKTIACEDVELFKAIHADKTWNTTEYVLTKLDVGGPQPAQATLEVRRSDKPLPVRGDRIEVLQKPSTPERVVELGTPGREMRDGSLAIAFGAVLLGIYFWNRRRVAKSVEEGQPGEFLPQTRNAAAPARVSSPGAYPGSAGERLRTASTTGRAQTFGQRR